MIEGEEMQRGYSVLRGVDKCAETSPGSMVLNFEGTGMSVALVGKGITFDFGGKQVQDVPEVSL